MTPLRSFSDISTLIRLRRRELGLTQADLAARAGIAEKHISRIENGASEPRISTVIDLLAALNLTLWTGGSRAMTGDRGDSVEDLF